MAANGNLIFQDTNKATFVGANSNVVIDTVHASFGVGVDVNGPTSNLHVVGNAYVTSNLEVGTANLFVDTVNSRVGVGTTSPIGTLSIVRDTVVAGPSTYQRGMFYKDGKLQITPPDLYNGYPLDGDFLTTSRYLTDGSTDYTGAALGVVYDTVAGSKSALYFKTAVTASSLTEKMRITGDGNVGIGTTSPDCNLEIYGDTSFIKLTRSRNNTNYGCSVDFALLNSVNEKFTYGRLSGSIADNTDGSEDGFLSFQVGTNGNMRSNYEEEKMRILSNGNVGIGTSSPDAKLHVNGGGLLVTNADTDVAQISAYGSVQGTGRLYVGQSGSYGGGIEYNGDNSPASTGAGADHITLFRVDNGTYEWTARNYYNSNNWEFRGSIRLLGSSSGAYTLSTDSTGNQLNFTHGSYSWGKWSNAHHYDVYSASDFTGSRDLYLNYYSGAAVRLTGNVVVSSDDRIKTNERYITDATETLLKLRPQIYDKGPSLDGGTGKTHVESGLIVQDIYYDAPELRHLVHYDDDAEIPDEKPYVDDDPQKDPDYSMWGTKSAGLNYEGLIAYLIKSNQELHTRIKALENAS